MRVVRFIVAVVGMAAAGGLVGLGAQALTGQQGWWLVVMMMGAIAGALLGYAAIPSDG